MISVSISLYLESTTRLARLEKIVEFHALPRTDEYVKLRNREMGDYFAFQVTQVTHRELGLVNIRLREPLGDSDDRRDEAELDEWIQSYIRESWTHCSTSARLPTHY